MRTPHRTLPKSPNWTNLRFNSRTFFLVFGLNPCCLAAENPEKFFDYPSARSSADAGWKPYKNFHKALREPTGEVQIAKESINIVGGGVVPNSRFGVRTRTIPLPAAEKGLTLTATVTGKGIRRAGILIATKNKTGKNAREAEWRAPGGDFTETATMTIPVFGDELRAESELTAYVYCDGAGTLELTSFSLTAGSTGTIMPPPPARRGLPATSRLELAPATGIEFLPAQMAPLLAGESRYFRTLAAGLGGATAPTPFSVENRNVAVFWDFATQQSRPYSVTLTPATPAGSLLQMEGEWSTSPSPTFYLYYYGKFRGKHQPERRDRDVKEMKALRELGVTGLVVHDNESLSYETWSSGKTLDTTCLNGLTASYKEAGFTSPMVYRLYTGLEKGRLADIGKQDAYMLALLPHLKAAEEVLGKGNLRLTIVDEPNDNERLELATKAIANWRAGTGLEVVVPGNWRMASTLPKEAIRWVGAGDPPSADEGKSVGIGGIYCSIDACEHPLRFRWISGVYAWALGAPSVAYWHAEDVSGTMDSDLDGKKPDYMFGQLADGGKYNLTVNGAMALEGLQDRRMLLEVEKLAASTADPERAAKAKAMLEQLRPRIPFTERVPKEWLDPQKFEEVRAACVSLLSAATPPPGSASPTP